MSWGDDPDLQANVLQLSKLVQQLEVGILWGHRERNDARALTEFLCQQCRARQDACRGKERLAETPGGAAQQRN